MDKTRNIFAVILSSVVVVICIIAVLSIWEVLPWETLRRFFWRSVQSLFVILIAGVVVYLIYALLYKPEKPEGDSPLPPNMP